MKISIKLTLAFFFIAFLPILIVGYMSYRTGKHSLEVEAFNKLTAVREMKASQIEDYFGQIHDQILTLSNDPTVKSAMVAFKSGFNNIEKEYKAQGGDIAQSHVRVKNYVDNEYMVRLTPNLLENEEAVSELSEHTSTLILQDLYISSNPHDVGAKHEMYDADDGTSYSASHREFHPFFKDFLEKFGYYDIFLVDNESGHIVYSVFKEMDYATSLKNGHYKNTNIASAFKESAAAGNPDFVELEDFKPYHPSYNAPASFISSPIYVDGKLEGVLIFQMPIAKINGIMTNHNSWEEVGLGKSGETYIVGEDYLLRNQSRFLIEDRDNYFKMIADLGVDSSVIDRIMNFNSAIGLQAVHTEGTEAALRGETGTRIFDDYRGVSVLSSYKPLKLEGMHWVIMSELDEEEAFTEVDSLRDGILYTLIGLALLVMIAALVIARQITRPLKKLTTGARDLARGNMDADVSIRRSDEIGILALSFRKMQESIKNLIDELKEINQNLENKVEERTQEIQYQKDILESKNREILDSINYAKRLQDAILPTRQVFKANLRRSFVMFKPKDIVSGDFYWMEPIEDNKVLLAVVDCTGHGVPGAMVSVVGANSLQRCVNEFGLREPAKILDQLSDIVTKTFESEEEDVRDGMDMSLVSLDFDNHSLEYAGANNPLWVVKHDTKELMEIKADKQPIGHYDYRNHFTNHKVQLDSEDCVYLFSDGYPDQFGGERGKKFKYKTLKDLLIEIHDHSMQKQLEILQETFTTWQGELDQIDDVCVVGVRI